MKNRFGAPEKPTKDDVKSRFSSDVQEKQAHIINEKEKPLVRVNSKGKRKQANFRLSVDVVDDLAFIAFATNEAQGDICEKALRKELNRKMDQLKKNEGEEGYDQLCKLFEKINKNTGR